MSEPLKAETWGGAPFEFPDAETIAKLESLAAGVLGRWRDYFEMDGGE